jgi:hypothetical protein
MNDDSVEHGAIGDWLQVNSPLGRPEQAFYVQVTGFTDYRKILASRHKFSRNGQQFRKR